jgi:hypothetical protein
VRLESGWKGVEPKTISVDTLNRPLLPRHVSSVDDWLADLQRALSSFVPYGQSAISPATEMLSFAEFKTLFEPRPIELMMIQK